MSDELADIVTSTSSEAPVAPLRLDASQWPQLADTPMVVDFNLDQEVKEDSERLFGTRIRETIRTLRR